MEAGEATTPSGSRNRRMQMLAKTNATAKTTTGVNSRRDKPYRVRRDCLPGISGKAGVSEDGLGSFIS